MRIELLYFEDCPSYRAFLPRLAELMAEAGVEAEVLHRTVESQEQARSERFLGSPTLRVEGIDVDSSAVGREDFGLKCRLYLTPAGLSPVPPDEWVLAALR